MSRIFNPGDVVQWKPNVLCGDVMLGGRRAIVDEERIRCADNGSLSVTYVVIDIATGEFGLAVPQELTYIRSVVTS